VKLFFERTSIIAMTIIDVPVYNVSPGMYHYNKQKVEKQ